ncbi:uncharacterized protein LOC132467080 [Gadus macrocephalus]|uniref:uncharacterized protein LOC132467080 n=1 Tax=Gadus macrocephalus TaxID=80720 RepID=UPI0028CB854D|nr:uncharacterized protein LOC132467080 [Gadus macrocephalus]
MESCWRLFVLVFLILPPAPQFAQEIVIPPPVVGYTGSYAILPCKLPNPGVNKLTQMQWDYVVQNTSKQILIYLPPLNVSIPDSPLKGRFSLKYSSEHDFSAVIREVVMADRGQYTCSLNVFPSGIFKLNTQLVVQDQKPLSYGALIGIVMAVAVKLSLVIMVAYAAIVRKRKTTLNQIGLVPSDTSGAETTGASGAKREEDLVYTDIGFIYSSGFNQPTSNVENTLSSNEKHAEEDDVTYSQVTVPRKKKNKERDTTV